MPFVSALYLHSLNSELLAVRDITLPATLVDDLSSYLWGLSDVLVALKIATVLTVLDRVGSRPGNAVFLSKSQFLARTLDSPSHTYTERGRTDTLLDGGAQGPCVTPWHSAGLSSALMDLHWPCRGGISAHTHGLYSKSLVLGLFLQKHQSSGCEGDGKNKSCQPADIATPPPLSLITRE